MEFQTRYSAKTHKGIKFKDASRTKQSFKDDADINNIMDKFTKTGILPSMIDKNPKYGDFSDVPDYLESINTVLLAEEQFAALSSKVRKKFDNDPAKFLEFVHNPDNLDEMIKMGLAEPRPAPTTPPVIDIPAAPPAQGEAAPAAPEAP